MLICDTDLCVRAFCFHICFTVHFKYVIANWSMVFKFMNILFIGLALSSMGAA